MNKSRRGVGNRTRKIRKTTSMIIPTYNRPESLRKTLQSIADQTVPLTELVILDDSTIAGTKSVVDEFKKKINIIYIKKKPEDRGTTKSGNIGIRTARGDYIFQLEDDITIHPDYVEDSLKFFEKNPDATGMCWFPYSNQKMVYEPIKNFFMRIFFLGHYRKDQSFLLPTVSIVYPHPLTKDIIPTEYMTSGTCVVKKEFQKKVLYDETLSDWAIQEDVDMSYRLHKKFGKLYLLRERKLMHTFDLGGRVSSKKAIYSKIIYAGHIFRMNFPQTPKYLIIFWWGMFGRMMLRAVPALLKPSKQHFKDLVHSVGATLSLLWHFGEVKTHPDYFKEFIKQ